MVFLVFLIFFVISFLTNILGPLIPDIIRSFQLSLTLVAVLPFSFFIAYGVMSIPSGILIEKFKEKPVILGAFLLSFAGALLFGVFPCYFVAIPSLFLIGVGMAALQVAINPLLRVAGGEKRYAFNAVFSQMVFGSASFLSPYVYTYLSSNVGTADGEGGFIMHALSRVVPAALPWVSLYWVFAAISLVMVMVIAAVRFPAVKRKEEEKAGAWETHVELLGNRTVLLFCAGIFAYVGTEQGIANWMSQFLYAYHGFDPQAVGAGAVSWFWGLMTLGCLLGLPLLKLFDSRTVLVAFSVATVICLSAALFGPAGVARMAFPALGFCVSVMWSIIFALALNSLDKHHGSFSGLLCTGIIGGAVLPMVIGWLGDHLGLRAGMSVLYLTVGYILSIGIWSRPLVPNETPWAWWKAKGSPKGAA
ncbi:MAG: MFS transporter [bacterium]